MFPIRTGSRGKGLGKGFWRYVQTQPATLLQITRRPSVTITMVRMGLFSTGRMITRWMVTPPTNAMTIVATNAPQYGSPALSSDQQR